MKRIFLFRHAQPETGGEKHICLGSRTDPALSAEGVEQAKAITQCFSADRPIRIYSSPLLRARQTTEYISAGRWEMELLPGMEELDCGDWDGLSFDEIRSRWPDEYAARGNDPSLPPPGGESLQSCAHRGIKALESVLDRSEEDILVVGHAGVNRALLSALLDMPLSRCRSLPQAYASVNCLKWDGRRLEVTAIGQLPGDIPNVEDMYARCGTPENVRAHCAAVKDILLALADKLDMELHREQLAAAAMLHDMCRHEKYHESKAAEILLDEGCLELGRLISGHNDCSDDGPLDGRKLLYLADKLCDGTERVSIKERFERSIERCRTPEAVAAHDKRKAAAEKIEKAYLQMAGLSAIEEVFI